MKKNLFVSVCVLFGCALLGCATRNANKQLVTMGLEFAGRTNGQCFVNITLKNCSKEHLVFHNREMPWEIHNRNMFYIMMIEEYQQELLKQHYPIVDKMEDEICVLGAGEKVTRQFDLSQYFGGLEKARYNIVCFWHYMPIDKHTNVFNKQGGWLLIPKVVETTR